ncbi:hypothetical protein, partial [Leucobacter chromiireducens]|uniref:hypothetical protein n=1 Tax=Leucobacter chromiireducens TaxID=283877 RepID=UPI0031D92C42
MITAQVCEVIDPGRAAVCGVDGVIDIAAVCWDAAPRGAAVLIPCGKIPALCLCGTVRVRGYDLPVEGDADFFPPDRFSGDPGGGIE